VLGAEVHRQQVDTTTTGTRQKAQTHMETVTATDTGTRTGGVGHSESADSATVGRESVQMALGRTTPAAGDLVIIFANADYDLDALYRAARVAAGTAPVVGATTCGAFTHETQVAHGCVAIHLAAADVSFGICHAERDDNDIAGSTRLAAETARDRAGEAHPNSVLMLLCDGLTPDQREMARGAYEVTSALVPMVGGAAGDDLLWQKTYTFGEDKIYDNGLVAVWINSPRTMAVSVEHGWHPFGKPMLVTRAEGAVIHELDGQPALDAYISERGAALKEDGRSFGEKCMERPIGLPNASGHYDLRQVHETVPGGGIVLTTGVPEQTVVRVMASDQESLLAGAQQVADDAAADLDGPPRMAIVFSCCTRAPLLGDRLDQEVDLISSTLGGIPAAGFYTCGEFARVTGSTGIHNSSVALLTL
jgi:hypothetical protein